MGNRNSRVFWGKSGVVHHLTLLVSYLEIKNLVEPSSLLASNFEHVTKPHVSTNRGVKGVGEPPKCEALLAAVQFAIFTLSCNVNRSNME
jgi:hypothetical protein